MNSITKLLFVASFVFIANKNFAQSRDESFYAFKEDWSPAGSIDSCFYFMHEIKKSDTEYVCRYYYKFGPMVKQETYRDEALSIPNGYFCWYNEKGKLDSCGTVLNFKKDGTWAYFLGDSTNSTYSEDYENGKFIKRNISHPVDTTQTEKDPMQKEALFRHGGNAWTKYVYSNIKIPDRFSKNLKPGKYVATVSFLINKKGKVENVVLLQSVEWSADAEVFKVVENSPDWQPAIQKGQPVIYRQRENITFSVEN